MNSITFKTETQTSDTLTLVFELSVSYDHMLTTGYGSDCPDDLLELDFDNDPNSILTYDLTCRFSPTETAFAHRLTESGYGSDYADYESINTPDTQSVDYVFGHSIAAFIAAELAHRNLPTTTDLYR